ncbi:NUDIX hydrolase YfcD [Aeromonas simiae]|uniref:NUDIX hydrolase YfcD n=1 Tax=Aeromonas simiae TaxID=218936 RepID=UPI00266B76B7|nr:NUDIX hydrolase YfcD [Aeromonas simiae]MDO2947027.1 NUDIX hydrolase YfcD [Aeromonas simiae]MDO2950639.1 NUDIX hydrolase YfcD [Aeromonas simiae]MDO2954379.1 NUDIX hydrolase YfcD [Aeromonas simiae]
MELVDVVDEKNQAVRIAPRDEVRRDNLAHRATYILVRRGDGRVVVQRRTLSKDFCPGMLDACCGGVVSAGEQYDESALRELGEELGIVGVPLEGFGTFHAKGENYHVWGGLYLCTYDGALTLQEEEVAAVLELTLDEIAERAAEFTPDSLIAIEALRQRGAFSR